VRPQRPECSVACSYGSGVHPSGQGPRAARSRLPVPFLAVAFETRKPAIGDIFVPFGLFADMLANGGASEQEIRRPTRKSAYAI
jgi:hypothetical protein